MIIAELRKAIVESETSQYRIAKETGISPPVLSRFVRGERDISLRTAEIICNFLDLHLRSLK